MATSSKKKRPPATTPEGREKQLIALATDLAEKQLREGTASNQVITHYLKLASTREKLEKEKLVNENEFIKAKTSAIESAKEVEALYVEALNAMRSYRGSAKGDDEEDED